MKYRYGDSTPFPLEDNFIDTIVAATDACVGLFYADVAAEKRRRRAHEVRTHAGEELRRLEVLEKAVAAALGPMLPGDKADTMAEGTAAKIAGAARAAVKSARQSVVKRRDAAVRVALGDQLPGQILAAIAPFLLEHQLPKAQWTVCWTGGREPGDARMSARMKAPCDLKAVFTVDIPEDLPWAGPVRVASLADDVAVALDKKPTLFRGARTVRHRLAKYHVTEVELSAERAWFVLRKSAKKPAPGFEIAMRSADNSGPVIFAIDASGERQSSAVTVSGDDALAMAQLWNAIERGMYQLLRHRSNVVNAYLAEQPVTELVEPAQLAEAILSALAPLVREMRLRSRVPGELILKRDLGDGRREELFVPRRLIESKFAPLPYEHRACFEAIGLGGEATREFVNREFPLSAPPNTNPNLARARRIATADFAA